MRLKEYIAKLQEFEAEHGGELRLAVAIDIVPGKSAAMIELGDPLMKAADTPGCAKSMGPVFVLVGDYTSKG